MVRMIAELPKCRIAELNPDFGSGLSIPQFRSSAIAGKEQQVFAKQKLN